MAFGMIKRIQEVTPDEFAGTLTDLDTLRDLNFTRQTGLGEVNRLDVVQYTESGGEATGLKPSIQVRVNEWNQQDKEVQDAVINLLKVMTRKVNDIDVIAKKI
jgi:hypothetical protein